MRASIELVRVDNRLVHGQVGVTWVNNLNVDTIVVVDDETYSNPFSQRLMTTIAKSSNVQIRFYRLDDFVPAINNHQSNQHIFVVVKNIETVYELAKREFPPQRVNIGNIHYEKGRLPFNRKVYLTQTETEQINEMAEQGFEFFYQDVPGTLSEPIEHVSWENLQKR